MRRQILFPWKKLICNSMFTLLSPLLMMVMTATAFCPTYRGENTSQFRVKKDHTDLNSRKQTKLSSDVILV